MNGGGARVRRDVISKRFDTEVGAVTVSDALMPEELLPASTRVWITFAADRLAVLPAGPAAVER